MQEIQHTARQPTDNPSNPSNQSGGAVKTLNMESPTVQQVRQQQEARKRAITAQGCASESDMSENKTPISDGSLDAIQKKLQLSLLSSVASWTAQLFPVLAGIAVFMVWLFSLAPKSHVDTQSAKIEQKIKQISTELKEQQASLKKELKELFDEKFGLVWRNLGKMEERLDKLRDRVKTATDDDDDPPPKKRKVKAKE